MNLFGQERIHTPLGEIVRQLGRWDVRVQRLKGRKPKADFVSGVRFAQARAIRVILRWQTKAYFNNACRMHIRVCACTIRFLFFRVSARSRIVLGGSAVTTPSHDEKSSRLVPMIF